MSTENDAAGPVEAEDGGWDEMGVGSAQSRLYFVALAAATRAAPADDADAAPPHPALTAAVREIALAPEGARLIAFGAAADRLAALARAGEIDRRAANDLAELAAKQIQKLRPNLLDLSRRNPLISTKLGPRSNSHIRVVDELPEILFYKLNNGQTMQFLSLPPIDDDPRDEATDEFRKALINARLIDEQYQAEMESIDRDAEDYLDRSRKIERALKDRVRQALGMQPRTRAVETSLADHARINGIKPSYELPRPDTEDKDGRYNDDKIQTLLLPTDLERKLNAIYSKCQTWISRIGSIASTSASTPSPTSTTTTTTDPMPSLAAEPPASISPSRATRPSRLICTEPGQAMASSGELWHPLPEESEMAGACRIRC
ncbi:MAG TPA: DUF4011 domain-containing protein [Xanthobacteraceae bacterium]|nr:DUF4011 domain-containing protein [Xanthobacteraceae bacterium]